MADISRIERICLTESGRIRARVMKVSSDDRRAVDEAEVVQEDEQLVGEVDQRLQDVGAGSPGGLRGLGLWGIGRSGAGASRNSVRSQTSSMPPLLKRVAAQQAPAGDDRAADGAQLADRLDRVGRAGRVVLAAPRKARRDPALVGADQGQQDRGRARVSRQTLLVRGSPQQLGERVADAVGAVALDQALDARAAPRSRSRGPAASSSASSQNASRTARFTLLRCTALPILRPTEIAEPRVPRALVLAAGERVDDQEAVAAGAALPVDPVEVAASREAPSSGVDPGLPSVSSTLRG